MKEDFLHYVWQNTKFDFANLRTIQGESLQIIHSGNYLNQSGPDFFNVQIIINNQKWAGNVEIHLQSSDWYLHKHENDPNYSNIILHVVWEHDISLYQKNSIEVPVLELKNYVDETLIDSYINLRTKKNWINCENNIDTIPDFVLNNWKEKLFIERLENKSKPILNFLHSNNNDWEATLFCFLAKNFGLNVNGESFFQIAQSIPFSVIRKESFDIIYLEALLFGQSNLIPETPQDNYVKDLIAINDYLCLKYKLEKKPIFPIEFFRLRPNNFPTIRLAQLAMVYHKHRNLFTLLIEAKSVLEIYQIFDLNVSDYWQSHYNFDKSSKTKNKSLTKSFINLIIINTILPIKFSHSIVEGKELSDELIYFLEHIEAEENSIVDKFKLLGINCHNAFDSQSILQLKNEYCSKNKCLNCTIGLHLLKN